MPSLRLDVEVSCVSHFKKRVLMMPASSKKPTCARTKAFYMSNGFFGHYTVRILGESVK